MAAAQIKIGTTEFTLTWTGTEDTAMMEKSQRTRALKLIDFFKAAGENSAPKERKTRTRKPATSAGTIELPADEA